MSLDVYLKSADPVKKVCDCCGSIYEDHEILYTANITHNLNVMAEKAGIYEALWRPHRLRPGWVDTGCYDDEHDFEDRCIIHASEIIPIIERGLTDLKARPDYFQKYNSDNGWGLYQNFVPFVEKYLVALKQYPDSIIKVSR